MITIAIPKTGEEQFMRFGKEQGAHAMLLRWNAEVLPWVPTIMPNKWMGRDKLIFECTGVFFIFGGLRERTFSDLAAFSGMGCAHTQAKLASWGERGLGSSCDGLTSYIFLLRYPTLSDVYIKYCYDTVIIHIVKHSRFFSYHKRNFYICLEARRTDSHHRIHSRNSN